MILHVGRKEVEDLEIMTIAMPPKLRDKRANQNTGLEEVPDYSRKAQEPLPDTTPKMAAIPGRQLTVHFLQR